MDREIQYNRWPIEQWYFHVTFAAHEKEKKIQLYYYWRGKKVATQAKVILPGETWSTGLEQPTDYVVEHHNGEPAFTYELQWIVKQEEDDNTLNAAQADYYRAKASALRISCLPVPEI